MNGDRRVVVMHKNVERGITLGSLLACVISWDRNHSILWAILHTLLGWIYVIYFAIVR